MHFARKAGFSIAEMAFVIIIIGIVAGITVSTGKVQLDYAKVTSTTNQIETLRQALLSYRIKAHHLPCPAVLADASGAATFGVAAATCDPAACPAGLTCNSNNIIIGTVPFKTLGLNTDAGFDSWDSKIGYAVDYSHTTNGGYGLGRIIVTDAAGNELTTSAVMGKAIFVLVSHGKDGNGGWSKNGVQTACGTTSLDIENCDTNSTFMSSSYNDSSTTANYYDDIVLWHSQGGEGVPTVRITKVRTERYNTCLILSNHRLMCVGRNVEGQLGLGDNVSRTTFSEVSGGFTDWTSVAFESSSMCAIRGSDGVLYCWGLNSSGQVGDSTSVDKKSPTPVVPETGVNSGWTMVDVDSTHACGIRSGHLLCWGSDANGKLGDDAVAGTNSNRPREVFGSASDWIYVGIGVNHSCGIRNQSGSKKIYCWGLNNKGQLGDGTTTARYTPVQESGGYTDWTQVDTNEYTTCGIRNGGELWCWGENANGQLGQGTTGTTSSSPVEVRNGTGTGYWADWTAFASSGFSVCATRSAGLYCWGSENASELLGNGAVTGVKSLPYLAAVGFTDWDSVSVGGNTGCGLRKNGNAYCWGNNAEAEIGNSTTVTPVSSPALVTAY